MVFYFIVVVGDGRGCAAGSIVDVLEIQALAKGPSARHFALPWVNQSTICHNIVSLYRFLRLVVVVVCSWFFSFRLLQKFVIPVFTGMTL